MLKVVHINQILFHLGVLFTKATVLQERTWLTYSMALVVDSCFV